MTGCTDLLAELGIPRTRDGCRWLVGATRLTSARRSKIYDYAVDDTVTSGTVCRPR
jgi:hypothetical protein